MLLVDFSGVILVSRLEMRSYAVSSRACSATSSCSSSSASAASKSSSSSSGGNVSSLSEGGSRGTNSGFDSGVLKDEFCDVEGGGGGAGGLVTCSGEGGAGEEAPAGAASLSCRCTSS